MHAEPSPLRSLVADLGLTDILSVSLSVALFHPTNYPDCSADVRGTYILHHILSSWLNVYKRQPQRGLISTINAPRIL